MDINWQPTILENDILKIIPLIETDFDCLFKVASDPLIGEQHPSNNRHTYEEFKVYFDGAITGNSAFKIIDNQTNTIIGSTRYYGYQPENRSIAIGYTFLAKKYWGSEYNKLTKKLLIDYAFLFVDKIFFHIGTTNYRSQKAITKIGAIKINEINFIINGQPIPHIEYLIQKET